MTERITDVKDVWVAWTNTDLTEGRGTQFPFTVCASESTAIRLGEGKYAQGTDCPVTKEIAVQIEGRGQWYAPCRITSPSGIDKARDEMREQRRAARKRALDLGLTEDDLDLLKQ